MKKKYLFAEAELILLNLTDVIANSEDFFVEEEKEEKDDTVRDPFTPQN